MSEDKLASEVQQLCLKHLESVAQDPRKEDEKSPGEAEEEGLDVGRKDKFPVRPEAEDCSFYLKTGTCKFGSNCKFNHPIQRKPQVASICCV